MTAVVVSFAGRAADNIPAFEARYALPPSTDLATTPKAQFYAESRKALLSAHDELMAFFAEIEKATKTAAGTASGGVRLVARSFDGDEEDDCQDNDEDMDERADGADVGGTVETPRIKAHRAESESDDGRY